MRLLPLVVALLPLASQPAPQQTPATGTHITLDVDASEAPRRILHASLTMPARAGDMTLFYPKWIPGEHMPSGPISNLAGLHVMADGKEVDWRRDLTEMFAFHVPVPAGARTLTVKLDYLVPSGGGNFGATTSTNATSAVINWYQVLLYPMGESPAAITVTASLKTPAGWKNGGALDVERRDGDTIHYAATSLESLNDHPVVLGSHFRSIELWPAGSAPGEHVLDVIADSDWALQFPQARIDVYKRIVLEERHVFGDVGHYRKYHWLLTLSDTLGSFGVEHHESADDRVAENTFVDDDAAKRSSLLLPHEFFHSWNGKAMRPAGLVTGGYEKPMKGDLLWVYEGMTNYYGELLAARGGLISAKEWMEELAADAGLVSHPGRRWRPLQDTADSAPFLYMASGGWAGWRRITDFYQEGSLIWLDADVTIRKLTHGAKSLDDFCTAFEGRGDNGKIWVKPYTADDVYAALNSVAPNDWKTFFEKRLNAKGDALPLGGVEGGGYKFVYNDTPNMFTDPWALDGGLHAEWSIGAHVTAGGIVDDLWPGTPADKSGIASGAKILAVNGRPFTVDELRRGIATTKGSSAPLKLTVDNVGAITDLTVDYHDGLKYPHLERTTGDDLLSAIAAPRLK